MYFSFILMLKYNPSKGKTLFTKKVKNPQKPKKKKKKKKKLKFK